MVEFSQRRSQEPLVLASGDTVCFHRDLPKYSAKNGWSVEYTAIGGGSLIVWNATTNVDGVSFDIDVLPAVTIAYVPGEYVLEGFATDSATGDRHQFYYNALKVTPNLETAQPDLDVTTHAQRMLASLENTLEQMAKHDINDSENEANAFHRKKLAEVTASRDMYLRERENELQREAALSGKPSRKKIKQVLLVTNPWGGVNQFGAGNNIGNFD